MRWKFWQTAEPVYMDDATTNTGLIAKAGGGLIGVYLVVCVALAWWWDFEPDEFAVRENASRMAQSANDTLVTGYTTTATLIRVAETLLEKRGGYLSNDRFPPGLWLDNMPNWEKGVLTQVRDLSRVIRNDYSRSQSQSQEDPDMVLAVEKFFSESNSWLFPPTERRYREGIAALSAYQDRLTGAAQPEAQFYARADNLREWLAEVEKRVGSMSRRLGNSVASNVINEELAGDPAAEAARPQPDTSTSGRPG